MIDSLDKFFQRFAGEEAAGVLRWAVEGCVEYQRIGLAEPEIIKAEVAKYRSDMDILGRYLDESCVAGEGLRVPKTLLYKQYQTWCQDNGYKPLPADTISRKLEERGYTVKNLRHAGKKAWCWENLGLQEEPVEAPW